MSFSLIDFIRESNRIEGIHREPTMNEVGGTQFFLQQSEMTLAHIEELVSTYQPDAILRNRVGLNVYVGNYVPPKGSPEVQAKLENLLWRANVKRGYKEAWELHCEYEDLHPFTDGNGRSGRALWLWLMGGMDRAPLGFLHHFYYQTLAFRRE